MLINSGGVLRKHLHHGFNKWPPVINENTSLTLTPQIIKTIKITYLDFFYRFLFYMKLHYQDFYPKCCTTTVYSLLSWLCFNISTRAWDASCSSPMFSSTEMHWIYKLFFGILFVLQLWGRFCGQNWTVVWVSIFH